MFEIVQPDTLATPAAPYSPAIVSGDLVMLSGQVPFTSTGELVSDDFGEQAHRVFQNIGECLRAAGCDFEDVLRVSAFLSDLSDFEPFNEVYGEYFKPPYPVRTTVGAALLGFKVELDAIARRPKAKH